MATVSTECRQTRTGIPVYSCWPIRRNDSCRISRHVDTCG